MQSTKPGHLNKKRKGPIPIGMVIRFYRLPEPLRFRNSATHQEILETISVAILTGSGPEVVYGIEALEALNQLETEAEK